MATIEVKMSDLREHKWIRFADWTFKPIFTHQPPDFLDIHYDKLAFQVNKPNRNLKRLALAPFYDKAKP